MVYLRYYELLDYNSQHNSLHSHYQMEVHSHNQRYYFHYINYKRLNPTLNHKNYLYIFCLRDGYYDDNKSVYEKHDTIENYVKEIFKKKLSKIQFFEYLIKRDKKEGLFMSSPHAYTSTDGIDYYDLHVQGKLK